MSQLMQDATHQDYSTQYPFPLSSRVEEMDEILGLLSTCMREERLKGFFFDQNLLSLLYIDTSSLEWSFETKNETFPTKEVTEEMMEYDVVVRMPPKRRDTIEMRVKSISKGKPIIVEPEELL